MKFGISLASTMFRSLASNTEPPGGEGNNGGTPGVTASIVVSHKSQWMVDPTALVFEVSVNGFDAGGPSAGEIYDDRFHELYYYWDFYAPGSVADNSYIFSAASNIYSGAARHSNGHKNSRFAYGPWVSHTYRTPGTYVVSVTVMEPSSGKYRTTTQSITIGSANALFSGTNTIFVSPDSDWSVAPVEAALTTSLAAAFTAALGTDTVPKRIMLNRGETFAFAGQFLGNTTGNRVPSLHIVASDGAGTKPVVQFTGTLVWSDREAAGAGNDKDFVIQNINFDGAYDSTTNTGLFPDCLATDYNAPQQYLLDGCLLEGAGHAYFHNNFTGVNVAHAVMILNDTTMTNYYNWGIYLGDYECLALTGASLRSHADALVNATDIQGGVIRCDGDAKKNIVHSSEFFCRQGWSPYGADNATQPAGRFNNAGYEGQKSNVQCNYFESSLPLSFAVSADEDGRAMNGVIEKNYLLGTAQTASCISLQNAGFTIRNNVLIIPDTTRRTGWNDPFGFVQADNDGGSDTTNRDSPIGFYNNTLVNLFDSNNAIWGDARAHEFVNSYFTAATIGNNVIHQPNLVSPQTSDAPLNTTLIGLVPYEKGYEDSTVSLQVTTATPPAVAATYAPLEGSAALGDADETAPVACDDFYGNPRPQYPSRGAFEMP